LHLLPEALNSDQDAKTLLTVFLIGVIFFFLLDKAQLWHHGHEHSGHSHAAHSHSHSHSHQHLEPTNTENNSGMGAWSILTGDAFHCFGDGILIASAFMADFKLGVLAAISVLVHETPHHMGDLMVLRSAKNSRKTALIKVSLSGAVTAIGGTLGYFLIDSLDVLQPFILVLASSSFIYVALADLIPQLQKRLSTKETTIQVIWLFSGIALVSLISLMGHSH
jgi:zinc and cadmium transporter